MFDIPITQATASNDGDKRKKIQYSEQVGILSSALEHAVPEQMFVNEQSPGEAISAVKALQKANAQGQRIYHITQANQSTILSHIHHDSATMTEIRNALNVGKEVITHTDAVSVPGWSGAGYIITDTETGAGAYKIAGGGNGGWLSTDFLLYMVALALGYVDGAIGLYIGKIFSSNAPSLQYAAFLARVSQVLGGIALVVSLALVGINGDLSLSQQLGQAGVTILGYVAVYTLTSAAVAALGTGALAITAGVALAASITYLVNLINSQFFSLNLYLRRRVYA